jgi:hypothetical protein
MQTAFMRKQLNSHHVRNNHSCSTQRLTMACYSGAVFTPLFFTIYKWADRLPLSGGRLRMAASKVSSPTQAACSKPQLAPRQQLAPSHSLLQATACSKPQLAPSHSLLKATACSKPQLAPSHSLLKATACFKPQLAQSHSLLQATACSKPQLAPRQQLILSSARQLQQPESKSVQALGQRSSREAAHSM